MVVTGEQSRRSANEEIREFAGSTRAPRGEWGFHCECGDPSCECTVVLSLSAFDQLKAAGGLVLYPRHERAPSARPAPFADTGAPIEYRKAAGRRSGSPRRSRPAPGRPVGPPSPDPQIRAD
jgi:hypothetical protein